ncbi:MAG TPA: hypothetical protein VJM50_16845 [Pyrinomonadaceae bacterium]|nr:hypothetical protein [Pyrinomonadaceae bacterium]
MTSKVEITAHCADEKEVKITLVAFEGTETVVRLPHGEKATFYVFDHRSIAVEETLKGD